MNPNETNDKAGFRQNVHGLRDDVGVLAGDLKTVASDTVQTAKAGAAELSVAARHAMETAKAKLHDGSKVVADAASSAKVAVEDSMATVKELVVKNPVTSVMIAAAAGVLIGMLLRSRR